MIVFLIKLFNFVIGCNCFDTINAVVHFFTELKPTFVAPNKLFFNNNISHVLKISFDRQHHLDQFQGLLSAAICIILRLFLLHHLDEIPLMVLNSLLSFSYIH